MPMTVIQTCTLEVIKFYADFFFLFVIGITINPASSIIITSL